MTGVNFSLSFEDQESGKVFYKTQIILYKLVQLKWRYFIISLKHYALCAMHYAR